VSLIFRCRGELWRMPANSVFSVLNTLAGRGDAAIVSGDILFDGRVPDSNFYRKTGFVEQLDMHGSCFCSHSVLHACSELGAFYSDSQCTIREALEFSALLRQDKSLSREEKLAYVDSVLDVLELTDMQDAIVGTTSAGLGLEHRKRLTIAVELVSRPAILFLDEPTRFFIFFTFLYP
jgi:ATP-binding cassette subfamily G (WHITE) protein 2 (SNQ2)